MFVGGGPLSRADEWAVLIHVMGNDKLLKCQNKEFNRVQLQSLWRLSMNAREDLAWCHISGCRVSSTRGFLVS